MIGRRQSRNHRFSPPARRGTACALVSGGLDSAVLLHDLLRRGLSVLPLYVRSGLRWRGTKSRS